MELTIKKWGNSAALRLPSNFLEDLNLKLDSRVEIFTKDETIIIKPVRKTKVTLDQLLQGITAENLHGEVSTGHAVGKEFTE